MYDSILIDITGGCNAKCPLCSTARLTFGQRINFISVRDFERTLDRLTDLGLVKPEKTVVGLFNWGEPILHPDLNGIVSAINQRGLATSISTNASKKTSFNIDTSRFHDFTFSVPGWSQSSYDKVHGLNFDRVKSNIDASITNLRATGYRGLFSLAFHVYQFNVFQEMDEAQTFCDERDIKFFPYYAYINDFERAQSYCKREMPIDQVAELSKSLFLHYVDDLISKQPADWECPQWHSQIVLNHKSEVLLCCAMPDSIKPAVIGSVFDLSKEEILHGKAHNDLCNDCMSCGQAYWGHNAEPIARRPSQPIAAVTVAAPTTVTTVSDDHLKLQRLVTELEFEDAPRALKAVLPLARAIRSGMTLFR